MNDPKLFIRKKGEDGTKTFSIRIKQETVNRIDELAKKTDRSRNELIGMLLDFGLDHCETE
ncbi:MAG: CopG family transcriptional regulator [Lachnospiraceae bacterium]|nr:CopG family transcriptional regulator [Lachnospiraceae bacterium]